MRRRSALAFALALAAGCIDFDQAKQICLDAGIRCVGGAGGGGGSGGGGTSDGGGICTRSGWCWENPLPQGEDLIAAWSDGPGALWAVGAGSVVVSYDRGAWRGETLASPEPGQLPVLTAITRDGQGQMLVADGLGYSQQLTDAGWGFKALDSVLSARADALWCGPGEAAVAAGLAVSPGESWIGDQQGDGTFARAWGDGGTTDRLYAVHGSSSSEVWAAGERGVVLRRLANVWSPVKPPLMTTQTLAGVWNQEPGVAWVVGDQVSGRYADGGWQLRPGGSFEGVSGFADTVWLAGPGGLESCATTAGLASCKPTAQKDALRAVAAHRAGAWVVGNGGLIASIDADGGASRELSRGRLSSALLSVAVVDESEAWACGDNGVLMHRQGGAWEVVAIPSTASLKAVFVDAERNVHVAAAGALYWRSRDGGQFKVANVYQQDGGVDVPAPVTYWAIAGYGATMFAVGQLGLILRWRGDSWRMEIEPDASGGAGSNVGAIAVTDAGTAWAAGNDALWYFDGGRWERNLKTGVDTYGIWASGPNDVHFVGSSGQWFRYLNGGLTGTGTTGQSNTYAVWGDGVDVFAIGGVNEGQLSRLNGPTWEPVALESARPNYSIGGTGRSIWLVGDRGRILRRDRP